ncbi:MAG: prepilin-type N-terminal cleavage/methylation domain-containing protein [Planctomycetes bacterium]|nr:prepilin-type N-terminal cleavage/methylation domain-containing protein [Planctomycetota bacterium]
MLKHRLLKHRLLKHQAEPPRASRGFTLIELLVVMSLVTILLGLGIGFLSRRGDDFEVALSILRDQLRAARIASTARHLPTEVVIEPGDEQRPTLVTARVLQPVGAWHMEDDPGLDDDPGLRTELTGTPEPGRFGQARRPDLGSRRALLTVPTAGSSFFDLRDGFAFRVDLRLDERDEMAVMRYGSSLELKLDRDLVPHARMVQTEGGGRTGAIAQLDGTTPLMLGRWHTLQLAHDRSRVTLYVDDREVASARATLPLLQQSSDELVVSGGDRPVVGLVDSVALWAYAADEPRQLAGSVRIAAEPRVIRFDRSGDLSTQGVIALTVGEERRTYRLGPGGVLE